MKQFLTILLCITLLIVGPSALAAASDAFAQLDQDLKAVRDFEFGKDGNPLVRIEQFAIETMTDPHTRRAVEDRLLDTLEVTTTRAGGIFIGRQLRTMGTARSVPHLERLLTDSDLSHIARYALGSMEIPEAAQALHRALKKTSGKVQVGIINTLADMQYEKALPDLETLLESSDAEVAAAAARGLGCIGGSDAVAALNAARPAAPKEFAARIDNALLMCAERFVAGGDTEKAAEIYRRFYAPSQPQHLRLAGLRGLVAARQEKAVPLLVDVIRNDAPAMQRSAVNMMRLVENPDATAAFVDLLASASPEAQVLILGALAARGEESAVASVAKAARSEHEDVRIAALEALGKLGSASSVRVLINAAARTQGKEKQVARASLAALDAPGVDAALIELLRAEQNDVRAAAVSALADRQTFRAVPALFTIAKNDDDESVRAEAISALGALGNQRMLPSLIELAVNPKDPSDRKGIEEAITEVFRGIDHPQHQADPVLAALRTADSDAKPTLLRLLARPATPAALAAVRRELDSADPDIRDAAVRTLAQWPNPAPADDLLSIAAEASGRIHKVLALRGYVRMAGLTDDPVAMYVRAMQLADRTEDKKLVLSGLGTANTADALNLVGRFLDQPDLQAEAALAAVEIADRLRQTDAARARAAMKRVVASAKDPRIRQKAQDIINEIDQYEGYIMTWLVSPPYTEKGKDSRTVFNTAFAPEKDPADVKWQPLTKGIGTWDINLEGMFGGKNHVAVYVKTRIWSPKKQKARLEMGADDALKAWLDGKLVHAGYQTRGLSPRQDIADVELAEGWNPLMLKVVNHEGGWAFCCRIRDTDGSALEGLKFEAR